MFSSSKEYAFLPQFDSILPDSVLFFIKLAPYKHKDRVCGHAQSGTAGHSPAAFFPPTHPPLFLTSHKAPFPASFLDLFSKTKLIRVLFVLFQELLQVAQMRNLLKHPCSKF